MERGGMHKAPPLAKVLWTVDSFWEKKSSPLQWHGLGQVAYMPVDGNVYPIHLWAVLKGLSGEKKMDGDELEEVVGMDMI